MLFRLALVLAACLPALAPPAGADPLTPEQKQAVEQLIRDTLTQHPELVIDALKKAQQQDDESAAAKARQAIAAESAALLSDPASPVGGNPAGDVTVVEFFDYRCPYCKALEPSLEALLKADPNLRIVYKEFPILGPASVYAARVALAARTQGRYEEFHRAMMAVKGTVDEDRVRRTAEGVGLDWAKIENGAESADIDRDLAANYRLARTLGVDGTPAFIVGDEMLPGIGDIAVLRDAVAKARKGG